MEKKNQRRKKIIIGLDVFFALLYTILIGAFLYLWGLIRLVDGLNFVFLPFVFMTFAILGLAFLVFRYLSNPPQFIDRKKEKKYFINLAIVLLVISVASITGIELKNYDLKTYTREKWLEKGYDRGRMIKSFTKKVDLVGKSKQDVVYFLGVADEEGKPYENDEFSYSYIYQLGNYLDWLDPSTFEVYFNDEHIVLSAEVVLH